MLDFLHHHSKAPNPAPAPKANSLSNSSIKRQWAQQQPTPVATQLLSFGHCWRARGVALDAPNG
eukprot:1150054-Pelagomonas_calceolata.AAC.4